MAGINKNILVVILPLVIFSVLSLSGCISTDEGETAEVTVDKSGTGEETAGPAEEAEEITSTETGLQEETNEPEEQKKDSEVSAEFKKIIEDMGSGPGIILDYIDKNIKYASTDTADYMIKELGDIQKKYIDIYTEKLFEGNIQQVLMGSGLKDIDKSDISDIDLGDGSGLIKEILNGGYKLIQLEGSYYPFIDYSLLSKYRDRLSARLQDYISIMAAESDDIYLKDAAIVIGWQELAGRLLRAERFLQSYPEQDGLTVEISDRFLDYLDSYIYGTNNTPTYDFATKKIKDEVLDSFNDTVSENKDTLTSAVIAEAIRLLQVNDLVFTDEVFEARGQFFKVPIKGYSLDSDYILMSKASELYYQSIYSDLGYIKLSDGSYTEEYEVETEAKMVITLSDYIVAGDLNGDDINDVALILVSSPGGSGTFFDLHFVLNDYSYIYDYSTVFLGDRIEPKNLSIEADKVFLNMMVHDEDDPLCCPTKDVLKTYVIFDGLVAELISHIGVLQKYNEEYVSVLVDDWTIDISLEDYQIGFDLEPGDLVYVEYIADHMEEADILYYIEPASR